MIKVFKAISAVLGIMICIALGVLGYAFYTSGEKPQDSVVAQGHNSVAPPVATAPVVTPIVKPVVAPAGTVAPATKISDIALGQPKGSNIVNVVPYGSLTYVTVRGGAKADRVLIVDMAKQSVVGQITLGEAKKMVEAPKP